MKTINIDIWSDVACPWCYIGKRRLERALATFSGRAQVTWHAFELNPSAPKVSEGGSYSERLAKKYGMSVQQAQAMIAGVSDTAKSEGLDFDLDKIRSGNTFDAHRLLCLARHQGNQDALKERLLRGYFCEGEAISDPETLLRLAKEAGVTEAAAREVLESDAFAEEVRADETNAHELGINAVPFFVLEEQYGISGAQSSDVLLRALAQATAISSGPRADGAHCGPDGC